MLVETRMRKDFLASALRYQICLLQSALDGVVDASDVDSSFVAESLKRVEINLKKLRKVTR